MSRIRWGRCPEVRPGAEEALTPRQAQALAHLRAAGCLTSGLLADLLGVDKPRARRVLISLRNRGLAVRAELRLRVRGRSKWVRVWFPSDRPRPEGAAEAERALVMGLVYAVIARERPEWRAEPEHGRIVKPDGSEIRVAVGAEGAADLRVLREDDPVPAGRFARAEELWATRRLRVYEAQAK
jgi:hypothetical protein